MKVSLTHSSLTPYKDRERLKRLIEEDERLIEASRASRRRQQEFVEQIEQALPLLRQILRRYALTR
jgi:hypothetical protein